MNRNDKNPVTELASALSAQNDAETPRALEPTKKPFIEPEVSVPLDVLEATAFFQGSATLDIADI